MLPTRLYGHFFFLLTRESHWLMHLLLIAWLEIKCGTHYRWHDRWSLSLVHAVAVTSPTWTWFFFKWFGCRNVLCYACIHLKASFSRERSSVFLSCAHRNESSLGITQVEGCLSSSRFRPAEIFIGARTALSSLLRSPRAPSRSRASLLYFCCRVGRVTSMNAGAAPWLEREMGRKFRGEKRFLPYIMFFLGWMTVLSVCVYVSVEQCRWHHVRGNGWK